MSMFNGLHVNNDLDKQMQYWVGEIKSLTDKIVNINKSIHSSEETLNDLRSEGLVTPELEETFSRAIEKALDEKTGVEKKRENTMDIATGLLNQSKEQYEQAIDKVKTYTKSRGAEVVVALRERIAATGEWKKALEDAMGE